MKKLVLGAMLMSSLAMAQSFKTSMKREATGGGNGGQLSEIEVFKTAAKLQEIKKELVAFLKSDFGQNLFSDIDVNTTIEHLRNNDIFEVVEETLQDKHGLKRDAVNYPNIVKVFFNAKSFKSAVKSKGIYILVLHEIFGLQGIEINQPGKEKEAYRYSLRIANYIIEEADYKLITSNPHWISCSGNETHAYRNSFKRERSWQFNINPITGEAKYRYRRSAIGDNGEIRHNKKGKRVGHFTYEVIGKHISKANSAKGELEFKMNNYNGYISRWKSYDGETIWLEMENAPKISIDNRDYAIEAKLIFNSQQDSGLLKILLQNRRGKTLREFDLNCSR